MPRTVTVAVAYADPELDAIPDRVRDADLVPDPVGLRKHPANLLTFRPRYVTGLSDGCADIERLAAGSFVTYTLDTATSAQQVIYASDDTADGPVVAADGRVRWGGVGTGRRVPDGGHGADADRTEASPVVSGVDVDDVVVRIRHDGGNSITGTIAQVLDTYLAIGWKLETVAVDREALHRADAAQALHGAPRTSASRSADHEVDVLERFITSVPPYVDFEAALWGASTALLMARGVTP